MVSNVKKGGTCRDLSWSKFKRIIMEIPVIYYRYLLCDSCFTYCYYVKVLFLLQLKRC